MICSRKYTLLISFSFGFFVRALSSCSFILSTIFVLFIVLSPIFLFVKHSVLDTCLMSLTFLRYHFSIFCRCFIYIYIYIYIFFLAFKAEKCFMNTPPVRCLVTWHVPVPAACFCHSAGDPSYRETGLTSCE